MKKSAIVLFFAAFLSLSAMAQNVQEGVTNIHAGRYASAKAVFDKLLATNPNNIEAIYWQGQNFLAQDNLAEARALYERAVTTNGNAPLLVVGLGHVELLEGKQGPARQRFDQAIAAARGKKGVDPLVLTAVGRANVDAYSDAKPMGDLNFAIDRLNEAAQQAPVNPEVYLVLGNAYRKKHIGGDAILAYRRAGNYAPALYRAAMLYKTQTNYRQADNWGAVLENLNNVLAADPRFAPALEELYYYNLLAKQDFPTAQLDASKLIAALDPSPENLYFQGQTQFAQKDYSGAIATGKNILAQTNNNPRPRTYRLLAYSYLNTKDTTTACNYANEYFAKVKEEDLQGQDYLMHAAACGRGNPEVVRADIYKAVMMDSVLSRQVRMLNDAAQEAKANGQRSLQAELDLMSYQIRGKQTNPAELVNISVNFFFGGAYQRADSVALAYAQIAPDSIHGYYWSGLARQSIDTAMTQGLAMPSYEKTLQIAETDKVRFRSQGVRAATNLAIYSFNIKEDKAAALAYAERGLAFDPQNANLLNVKNVASAQPKAAPPATPKKPATPAKGGTKPPARRNG
jgi:tetratricopeptide (TPR) repeat protein